MRFSFLAYLLQGSYVLADCNLPGPLAFPVTNVQLAGNNVMRGVQVAVGTPPQNLSVMPHIYLNDTWVYNTTDAFCPDGSTDALCFTYRGGLYDVSASTTSDSASDVYAAGGDPSDVQRVLGTHIWYGAWVNDLLSVGNIDMADFPLGLAGNDFGGTFNTQNVFGLGSNSTILNTLVSMEKIASRSWSWWWGQTGATDEAQMDGSIVFGGYDKAKTLEEPHSYEFGAFALDCQSGMHVTITDLVLTFPNGSTTSILYPNQLSGCLQPDFPPLMTLPNAPYFENFERFTQTRNIGRGGGNGIGARGMLYQPDEVYQGGLTVEINNNFSVEVPNEFLVVPPGQVAQDGSIDYDTTVSEVMLDPTINANAYDPAILGRPFFSVAYLNVDHDSNKFTLWKANPTTDTDLRVLGDKCPNKELDTPGATESPSASGGQSEQNTSQRTDGGHRLSTGAIAGIAVGAVAGTAIVTAAALLLYLHRRKTAQTSDQADNVTYRHEKNPGQSTPMLGQQKFSEAMSSQVQELGAWQDPRELAAERDATELSTARSVHGRRKNIVAGNNSPVELG